MYTCQCEHLPPKKSGHTWGFLTEKSWLSVSEYLLSLPEPPPPSYPNMWISTIGNVTISTIGNVTIQKVLLLSEFFVWFDRIPWYDSPPTHILGHSSTLKIHSKYWGKRQDKHLTRFEHKLNCGTPTQDYGLAHICTGLMNFWCIVPPGSYTFYMELTYIVSYLILLNWKCPWILPI